MDKTIVSGKEAREACLKARQGRKVPSVAEQAAKQALWITSVNAMLRKMAKK